jgi:hypothetical protein
MPVVRLSHLPNKDEEENACAGRKYNHECNCIKQVPDRKILIVCFHLALVPGVLNLSIQAVIKTCRLPAAAGLLAVEMIFQCCSIENN